MIIVADLTFSHLLLNFGVIFVTDKGEVYYSQHKTRNNVSGYFLIKHI